jgi:hypothetical protein
MDHQRLRVADVGEMRKELQCLDEGATLRPRAVQVEAEDRAAALGQKLRSERVIGMIGKLGIADRFHHRMRREERDDPPRVLDVPRHPQRQRLDPLQDLERRERRHARAEIADSFTARAQQKSRGRRLFAEHHVVKAGVRLGQRRKLAARLGAVPVELSGIDEQAADHHAVTREELGRGVEDEIGAMRERLQQPRRGERRVHEQRQAVVVCELGHARNVEDVEARIAERFAEQQPCLGPYGGAPCVEIARIDEVVVTPNRGSVKSSRLCEPP